VVATAQQDATNATADLNEEVKDLKENTEKGGEGFQKFAETLGTVSGQVTSALGTIGNIIDFAFGESIQNIEDQIESVEKKLEDTLERLGKAQEEEQERLDENLERELERRGLLEESAQEIFEAEQERLDKKLEGTGLAAEEITALDDEQLNAALANLDSRKQADDISQQVEETREAERAALIEDTNNQKLESEKQYLAAVDAAETEAAKKLAKLEYEASLAEWKNQRNQAIINTITASLAAFTSAMSLPFPANVIVGAATATAATAFGIAQTVAISKNKPQPPSFEVGAVDIPSDTMAQVHEGEMIVPKTFAESVREGEVGIVGGKGGGAASDSGSMTINLQIDATTFGRIFLEKTKAGEWLVSDNAVVAT
jgi:hypothetical protein